MDKVILINFLVETIQNMGANWVTQLRVETIGLFQELEQRRHDENGKSHGTQRNPPLKFRSACQMRVYVGYKHFNMILSVNKKPSEWRGSTLNLFIRKKDIQLR